MTEKQKIILARKAHPTTFLITGILILLGGLAVIAFPIIWIWDSWSLAWKVGLSGFIISVLFTCLSQGMEKAAVESLDEELKNIAERPKSKTKSKFQLKLEKIAAERGVTLPNQED